ncbi:MAG TPA: 1,2-phenylacetyl-CoA epoxidase subunit PaaD [Rhizomicrobium sp.]|nr:1,2-phenylacetyl-CoA epoxidase subunit PaaD [Rhizomicrobium sp.]
MVSPERAPKSLSERVIEILSRVPDPEIPCVSVVDLGIIREVTDGAVVITPTYTGCPATLAIEKSIRVALDAAGLSTLRIETTLSPPWTTDWISAEGMEKLRSYGIAPPSRAALACPRCGSTNLEEISRFGSTPCKALYRCLDCREPFDRFKCH